MRASAVRPLLTRAATGSGPTIARSARRARRAAFIARVKALAAAAPADVELTVAASADIARGVILRVEPHTRNVLRIGELNRIESGVTLLLKGGTIELGPSVEIRRGCVLDVGGHLTVEGHTPISWNSVIHCDHSITLMDQVGLAEQVTIADSSHFYTTPDEHFWHNKRTAPVTIGRNTWLCPKCTIARGTRVGDHCIVASNSVVVSDVPDGSLASGVPATIRPLPLPWLD